MAASPRRPQPPRQRMRAAGSAFARGHSVKHQRVRLFAALTAAVALGAAAAAQGPPRMMNAYELIDTGPVRVPAACRCISSPFTVPAVRPGWGHWVVPVASMETVTPLEAARTGRAKRYA